MKAFLGIDVGTGSVRAGLFDSTGQTLATASEEIAIFRPGEGFVEQSSEDIWRAVGVAVRQALKSAGLGAQAVRGIGFDATCSLVALDECDRPVSVSPTGRDEQNVVVWMDHRALEETELINRTQHEVLRYVGGSISVEMEIPKLLWLKRHLPHSFRRTARFLDLPDFLTYRATGVDSRSQCSTVCKWTYLGHLAEDLEGAPTEPAGAGGASTPPGWSSSFFSAVGLEELLEAGARRIGSRIVALGERMGELSERSAAELGLNPGIPVGVSIIDAHAGGIGLLGMRIDDSPRDDAALEERLALICGTSTCHMAVSREPRFVAGIWGPYRSAMVPGLWLNEGGQSATGALIDYTIDSHALRAELNARAVARGTTIYDILHERLEELSQGMPFPAALTRDLHVLGEHHGNRSPRADATLRGMVSGLKLSSGLDQLAVLYLATIQSLAQGTRHIIETLNREGYRINTLLATGGNTKNTVFLREHADVTGCRIVLPEAPESVLLGSALLGAVAAGEYPDLLSAMSKMTRAARVIEPTRGEVQRYHQAKRDVHRRMYHDQMAYRSLMCQGEP